LELHLHSRCSFSEGMMFVENKTVIIRPISKDDFNEVLYWSKDDAFCLANDWELNRNPDELGNWWARCVDNKATDFIRMGIEWDNQLIGYADLAHISGNTAELGIAIGNSALWGKGIGTVAADQWITYASKAYNLSIFHAETHETNFGSRKMLEKLGFQEISRNGSEVYKGLETKLIQYQLIL
jgi:[ribosomal protein S5]-alanine N-acetyltransferase